MKKVSLVILIASIFLISSCTGSPYTDEQLSSFATCLADKDVKEYGAFWCPNCAKQAKLFGDAEDVLKSRGVYIECDPRCSVPEDDLPRACRGVVGRTDLCLMNNIQGYPTWDLPDDVRITGVTQLEDLARMSGCTL